MLAFRSAFTLVVVALLAMFIAAQNQQPAGKPIGSISTHGDLIVLTLDEEFVLNATTFLATVAAPRRKAVRTHRLERIRLPRA